MSEMENTGILIDVCTAFGLHPFQLYFLASMSFVIVLLSVLTFKRERKSDGSKRRR